VGLSWRLGRAAWGIVTGLDEWAARPCRLLREGLGDFGVDDVVADVGDAAEDGQFDELFAFPCCRIVVQWDEAREAFRCRAEREGNSGVCACDGDLVEVAVRRGRDSMVSQMGGLTVGAGI